MEIKPHPNDSSKGYDKEEVEAIEECRGMVVDVGKAEENTRLEPCNLPRDIDIKEVEASAEVDEDEVVFGGLVEAWGEAKIRIYITATAMVVWVVCTLASLVQALFTGDPSLLIAVLSVALLEVLGYYFSKRNDK